MATLLGGCADWLREDAPGKTELDDFFTSGQTALQAVNAAYYPMAWEYHGTYYSEWFVGDIASDDAVKGGQNLTDMADAYDIENFKTVPSNGLLLDYYRAQYQGISRCNFALTYIPSLELAEDFTEEMRNRYIGELKVLRAFYYFRLVRMYGGVPLVDFIIDSSEGWKQPRATAEQVYEFIIEELEQAEPLLVEKSKMTAEELGRVTKGAAQALLLKVNLYAKNYTEAKSWGEKIIAHYKKLGIDPKTKTLLFSDSLNFDKAEQIYNHFKDRINVSFGIGTFLSNDTHVDALNIVIKLQYVNGHPVAKLSDTPGKAMCQEPQYVEYLKNAVNYRLQEGI